MFWVKPYCYNSQVLTKNDKLFFKNQRESWRAFQVPLHLLVVHTQKTAKSHMQKWMWFSSPWPPSWFAWPASTRNLDCTDHIDHDILASSSEAFRQGMRTLTNTTTLTPSQYSKVFVPINTILYLISWVVEATLSDIKLRKNAPFLFAPRRSQVKPLCCEASGHNMTLGRNKQRLRQEKRLAPSFNKQTTSLSCLPLPLSDKVKKEEKSKDKESSFIEERSRFSSRKVLFCFWLSFPDEVPRHDSNRMSIDSNWEWKTKGQPKCLQKGGRAI